MFKKNMQLLCTINYLPCVIPSEAKESRLKIATPACQSRPSAGRPACHNKALRCAGTSLMLLAMTTYRNVKDGDRIDLVHTLTEICDN